MTNIFRAVTVLGILSCSPALASDLYRCDFADGRVVYQGTQCQIGVRQRAIDSENAKREQIERELDRVRQLKQLQKDSPKTTAG